MEQKDIKWLFFDMGGVVLDDTKPEQLRQSTLLEVAQKFKPELTLKDIYDAWLDASKIPGSVRINALHITFKDSPDLSKAEEEFIKVCNYDYRGLSVIRPEAKMVFSKLSQKYKLGIMANQGKKTSELVESAGLLPYLSHQKMSEHIGLNKPDTNFYLTILNECGADAHESVIIDDNWFRGLLPAKKLGMKTVLYQREIIPFPDDADPDYTINKLEDLIEIFT